MTEKVIRNGLVAVLVSPHHGAGWSTPYHDELAMPAEMRQAMLFDHRFVAACEADVDEDGIEAIATEVLGPCDDVYLGGWGDIVIEWVPVGTRFFISNCEGFEVLHSGDSIITA